VHCERHRPEQTTLHRLVQQHAQTFFAQAEEATGASLPQFVKDEFEAVLGHGRIADGADLSGAGDPWFDGTAWDTAAALPVGIRR